ncbi:arsenic transporter [Proteiniclasticum sp. SCR006]|uniref:Arsenic transporter n=1 Tax=Proteiniclasticum aestuarii TaxID=2817862 RepID=A0A939HE03_9CLOT|nr:SLC13 family permease [Proteiniclasticum aestuarii]MBO1265820.1 arsenic transporter [Proteiniclasticum aestuarii]
MKIAAIIIFILTYVLLLALPRHRAKIAVTSATLFVVLGIIPIREVLTTIDWNVIFMIAGTMGLVSLFIDSKMPSLLADIIIEKTPNVMWAIVSLSLFAGIISAFVDNVATVLMVAPVALTICKKLGVSPISSIIAISVASNLQGAATLVGDTTSILLAGHLDMNFFDFFIYNGKIGLFFIVQVGAIMSTLVLFWIFRKEKQPVAALDKTVVTDYFPSFLLIAMVLLLIIASFIPNTPRTINGLICMALLLVGLVKSYVVNKDKKLIRNAVREIDYVTLLLLSGLFIVVGGISAVGVIEDIAALFVRISGDNLFLVYTLIVWFSVLISAFIDNIIYTATMLPVIGGIASLLGGDPTVLYFGLIIGATLGGNLTPIGASANIAGIGILTKQGFTVTTKDFTRIGVPFTLIAVLTGYILTWILFA